MKASTQQIAQVIVQTSEEIKQSTQNISKSVNEIDQVLESCLIKLKDTDLSVDVSKMEEMVVKFDKAAENRINELNKKKKQSPYLLYSLGILVVSIILLVLAFKYGYQTKQELRLELEKESVIVPKEDYIKLKGFADSYAKDFKKYEQWFEKNK
jgi:hypothetical protein